MEFAGDPLPLSNEGVRRSFPFSSGMPRVLIQGSPTTAQT
jgi:hypothetical protein